MHHAVYYMLRSFLFQDKMDLNTVRTSSIRQMENNMAEISREITRFHKSPNVHLHVSPNPLNKDADLW